MKKGLFLLFVVIVLFSLLNETKKVKREKIERIDVNYSEKLEFNGTLFLPQTIYDRDSYVKGNETILRVAGKNYRYVKKFDSFYLVEGTAREISVELGDRIETDLPLKLFFAREV